MKVILSQMSLRACETLKPFALSLSISPVLFPNTPRARSDNCDNRPPAAGVGRAAPGGPRQHRAVKLGRKQALGTFACHLLMPFDDYRAQLGDAEISGVLLTHITDRYGVSLTAAVRRWIEFTDKRAAIVVARDGFALWGGGRQQGGIPKRHFHQLWPGDPGEVVGRHGSPSPALPKRGSHSGARPQRNDIAPGRAGHVGDNKSDARIQLTGMPLDLRHHPTRLDP